MLNLTAHFVRFPAFSRHGAGGEGEEKGYRLPPFWNSLRITLFSLIGVVLVPLMAPVFLLALVCYRFLRPTNRSSE
jgi:hypothetical protein